MVIIVDWEQETEVVDTAARDEREDDGVEDDEFAGTITPFSTALACYPVVLQIASHLDLNSLHDLSATCRQFRFNLLRFRSQLLKRTLHCINDDAKVGPRLGGGLRNAMAAWNNPNGQISGSRMTSGRVGNCARDMVGDCRRCLTVVCRNCTIRQPPPHTLEGRYRRLCRVCQKAPLHLHQTSSTISPNLGSLVQDDQPNASDSFTRSAFAREPCTCSTGVHLCLSCGNILRTVDTTYSRGWTWRTRYSTYLGGLGTGIGEGNEGVECGKQDACLDARTVEKEIDCDAEELAEMRRESELIESGRSWQGTSYLAQEMEGIGGVVKKKVKKRVKVGATVKEYEDERETGKYLWREQTKLNRSWCCWCSRIVLGGNDLADEESGSIGVHGSGSGSST